MEDKKKELTPVDQLAIMMVQTQQVWQLASDNDWPDNLRALHKEFDTKQSEFAKEHFPAQHSIIGSLPNDDDRSHYDIDDQIDNHFDKKKVQTDSESGMFAVYMAEDMVDEVKTWLKENWPTLEYKVHKDDDSMSPLFNSTAAEKHVKDNNLEVEPPIAQEVYDKIKDFDLQIGLLQGEKERYIKSI